MKGEQEIPMAMTEQRVVFLVVVKDTGEENGYGNAVVISAIVSGAAVSVNNPAIKSGEVAEVTVIPDQTSTNNVLTLTINGDRSGFKQTETIDIEVIDWKMIWVN
jgi:archaellum component FlaG (FlaF/FlaG flagellin family)